MVRVENLVVKGKYFIPGKFENITSLKNLLIRYMGKKLFEPEDIRELFFQDRFLTLNFRLHFEKEEIPINLKLKRFLHLISDKKIQSIFYFNRLNSIRNEHPFEVKMLLTIQKIKDVEGIVIEISSIPAVYYKISQINKNIYLDDFDYSNIIFTNKEFIKEIMASIHARPLEEPRVISEYIKTEVSKRLRQYGFNKISNLLEEGKNKIEIGQNGMGELIGVIENFLYEIASKITDKPAQLHQPEKNIDKLKSNGYINDEVCGTLQKSLFQSIYRKLKDKDHKKEEIDYFDLKLYYQITEDIIDYLLDRIIKYKVKSSRETN